MRLRFKLATTLQVILVLLFTTFAQAETERYASESRANAAVTYYARSRTMLVEALAEYEQGRKYARPDMLHDSEEFRLTLISLTEQLNSLVDPKIRITRDGVRVRANPRMIMRKSKRLPEVINGAEEANDNGEKRRLKRIQESRAKLEDAKKLSEQKEMAMKEEAMKEAMLKEEAMKKAELAKEIAMKAEMAKEEAMKKGLLEESNQDQEIKKAVEQKVLEAKEQNEAISALNTVESEQEVQNDKASIQEDAVASAIEKTIQERLKSLEVDLEN